MTILYQLNVSQTTNSTQPGYLFILLNFLKHALAISFCVSHGTHSASHTRINQQCVAEGCLGRATPPPFSDSQFLYELKGLRPTKWWIYIDDQISKFCQTSTYAIVR